MSVVCVYVERRACIYKYEESGSVSLFVYLCVCWLVSKSIGGGICVRGGYESVDGVKFFLLSLCV